MITVIQDWNKDQHYELLNQMFKLRAKVFSNDLGWDVSVIAGLEKDRFDEESPVYIVDQDDEGSVIGSCRLMPTTGQTLLSEVFGDTIPDGALLSHPTIWECTRFCIDYELLNGNNRQQTLSCSSRIIGAVGRICIAAGVETVLGNFDRRMLRIYRRVGCKVECIGSTNSFGNIVYLGTFSVSRDLLEYIECRANRILEKQAFSKAA